MVWEWIKNHQGWAAVSGALLLPAAIITSATSIESLWALVSDDPLIPVVGRTFRQLGSEMMPILAVAALGVLVVAMVRVQSKILQVLRAESLGLPPDSHDRHLLRDPLHAGADMTIDLSSEMAATAKGITFSARQGHRVIVSKKTGEIDSEQKLFRMPLKAEETRKLRDGYLLMQAYIVTGEGNRTAFDPVVVPTRGPLVERPWYRR